MSTTEGGFSISVTGTTLIDEGNYVVNITKNNFIYIFNFIYNHTII